MNTIAISGRLTKPIELKYTINSKECVMNAIAVQRDYKNSDGEYPVDFIKINVFGPQAKYLEKYAEKGSRVLVKGKLYTGSYEKDGSKIPTSYIMVDYIEIFDFAKKNEQKQTEVIKETKEEKKGISDDVFAEFGSTIEIDESEVAF